MQGADDGVATEFLDLLIQLPGLRRALAVRSGKFRADTAETLRVGGDPLGGWQGQNWRHSGDGTTFLYHRSIAGPGSSICRFPGSSLALLGLVAEQGHAVPGAVAGDVAESVAGTP